jgi:uncharacterized OB-fold protein
MPMRERIDSGTEIMRWNDGIPLHYEYTAGVAGEKFLRGLIAGKIIAGRCATCTDAFLPPRIYCPNCYTAVDEFVEVGPQGKVVALTKSLQGQKGERLEAPVTFGFIGFKGVRGGIVHRILGNARVGSTVVPQFKPEGERTGSILDMVGFKAPGKPPVEG